MISRRTRTSPSKRPEPAKPQVFVLNKPFQVLSQFSPEGDKSTLASYFKIKNFYPAGRLDFDSEGLLALTNSGKLQNQISSPMQKMEKTYWVQIEGIPNSTSLLQLKQGVSLKDGLTLPAKIKLIEEPILWERQPPIRERKNQPTSWLEIKIIEGKNRQVRRMTAAIGHPTLRLIRAQIGPWKLETLQPGEYREVYYLNRP